MADGQRPEIASVGRNAPCPCGSGRRYKECHGALATSSPPVQHASNAWIPEALRDGASAQDNGRFAEAAQAYRRVVAADPSNFAATHGLCLVECELGHRQQALALMKRAIELRPDLRALRKNLRYLEALPAMETEICRVVFARMLPRVDTAFDTTRFAAGPIVHIVTAVCEEAELEAVARVVASSRGSPVQRWCDAGIDSIEDIEARRRLTADDHPNGGWVVFVGSVRSPAAWLRQAEAAGVVLVATRDEPCALIDRTDEFSAAGYVRPALLCATSALARRLGVPATAVLEPQ